MPTRSVSEWFGPRTTAASGVRDSRQCEAVEMMPHVFTGLFPDRQQDALTLVITRSVGMRLAEVAQSDRTVDGRDDLRESDLVRRTSQGVPAPDTTFGTHQSGSFQSQEDLLEVGLG